MHIQNKQKVNIAVEILWTLSVPVLLFRGEIGNNKTTRMWNKKGGVEINEVSGSICVVCP
jgi:hypothetical protein